ncbi:MBL fold metallo-hydrolase [Aeromicrobium sp. P5_D10]
MGAAIQKVVTSGQFCLDGGSWDVDNNVWLVGDDAEVIVVDAPHDASKILDAIDGRTVLAIVLTHGHNDHINAAVELSAATGAPIWFPAADRMLWDAEHATAPDHELASDTTFEVAGTTLRAIATPGHSPGSTCLYAEQLGVVFTGDTLFNGGPGATGRSYSDFGTIIDSIRDHLLTLPTETVVHTGHGDDTSIGAEAPHLDEWIARGA